MCKTDAFTIPKGHKRQAASDTVNVAQTIHLVNTGQTRIWALRLSTGGFETYDILKSSLWRAAQHLENWAQIRHSRSMAATATIPLSKFGLIVR